MKNEEYRRIEDVIDLLSPDQLSAVADIYENGIGVPIDTAAATRYYKMAADGGSPYAQYRTAMRISDGDGALLWLHASAEQGFSASMKELSDRLREIDPRASQRWLRRYYKIRDKREGRRALGRCQCDEAVPEVIDGEVMIKI